MRWSKKGGITEIDIENDGNKNYEDDFYNAFFRDGHSAAVSRPALELEVRLEETPPSLPSCTWSRNSSMCRPECSSSSPENNHLLHHRHNRQHNVRHYSATNQPGFVWSSRSANGARMPITDGCVIKPRLVPLGHGEGIGDRGFDNSKVQQSHPSFITVAKPFRFYGGYLVAR